MKITWIVGSLLTLAVLVGVSFYSHSTSSSDAAGPDIGIDAGLSELSDSGQSTIRGEALTEAVPEISDRTQRSVDEQEPLIFLSSEPINEYAVAHQLLIDRYGVEEADFRMALGEHAEDWEQLKKMIKERDEATGQDHSRILFEAGLAQGKLSRDELISLLQAGVATPQEAFDRAVFYANTEALDILLDTGFSADFAAEHPFSGADSVATLVQRVGWQPAETNVTSTLQAIDRLVRMGASPSAGLNAALRGVNPSNAEPMFAIATALRQQGGTPDPSIRAHVERLRDEEYRPIFLEFFE
ncbi:MAG: hypothetical protein AAGL69_08070 [Pseudomonadota bacterium]